MSAPFVAEIRAFPFNFAPRGWAFCDGQILPLSQNTALFSLLGTNYGGDGKSNFALPNLQGSAAMHTDQFSGGGQYSIGETGGSGAVTLLQVEMPTHTHAMMGDISAFDTSLTSPSGAVPSRTPVGTLFYSSTSSAAVTMSPMMISTAGLDQPHNNMMPYLTLNYCIALQGVFPPRS